ncbi:hypothetical protein SELMODRAFT_438132 [Selaginella moellendorffii]|uniref:Uncharacterized protein n=1 Tax=Selaginella moellendorffii TaxID=88036 RepID=D8QUB7_SELML|nr:uncharacterized protein LOC9660743 [Selaginella moellendorffii]EFJ35843.1 hypothetical protein SELMODRAFT_438132 [Selaginella moellendorffii]|eukprot:XP_002962380.1 uncharacterized protein LOC9660743 [Selaginella moellendorffii]
MAKFASLLQVIALLLQLADCRKLKQQQQHGDSSTASLPTTSSNCLKFDSTGLKCDQTFPESIEKSRLLLATKPEELVTDRAYESSPPKRTNLSDASSATAATLDDEFTAPSTRKELSEDDFEETMRTDYAPVRRKPPINNEVPFFASDATRRTSP